VSKSGVSNAGVAAALREIGTLLRPELDNVRWGVDMARRGWLTRREVLNTRDVDAFRAAVRP
jgi:hypothetical protein